jgi:hypothetical protein
MLWENREVTDKYRNWTMVYVVLATIIFGLIYFTVYTLYFQSRLFFMIVKQPSNVNCAEMLGDNTAAL